MSRRLFYCCAAVVLASFACATPRTFPPPANCNQAANEPIVHLRMPGSPFMAVPTSDGCWLFVSIPQPIPAERGLAVVRRSGGAFDITHIVHDVGAPAEMTLTSDGRILIAAAQDRVDFFDVAELIAGGRGLLGELDQDRSMGIIAVAVTSNDSLLFVSNEFGGSITVVNFLEARRSKFRSIPIIGHVPDNVPISLVFSPDQRRLYATSMVAPETLGWPRECLAPSGNARSLPRVSQGAIVVIDVAKAAVGDRRALLGGIPAGCSAVRLALSPSGDTGYVTARWDNAVRVFDIQRILGDPAHALLAKIEVGSEPVGVLPINGGRQVAVANSNRFEGSASDRQSVSIVDVARLSSPANAVMTSIPAGAFPRDLSVTADGRTLLLTNFVSRTVEIIDLERALSRR